MWLANPHSILRGGFSLSRAKAVFIPPAKLVVVARSSYPTEKQKLPHKNTVRQLLLFICCVPCACRQFRSTLFCPRRRSFLPAVFVPVGPPGFPENGRLFCRKVVLCPGKSTGRLLRPFIPLFPTDFTMFFAKKALQMNFKNILYNYRFNFFTQIVSYRFVWGSRVCAFCTASALR